MKRGIMVIIDSRLIKRMVPKQNRGAGIREFSKKGIFTFGLLLMVSLQATSCKDKEGGVRTPFIARWPGHFPQGAVSKQLFALNDIMATLASVLNSNLPDDQAVDSFNLLPVLRGNEVGVRPSVVIQSGRGDKGLRMGKWKYIEPSNANSGKGELYNLEEDTSEEDNLIGKMPVKAQELKSALDKIVEGKSSN